MKQIAGVPLQETQENRLVSEVGEAVQQQQQQQKERVDMSYECSSRIIQSSNEKEKSKMLFFGLVRERERES